MARSGSFNTSSYSGRYLTFAWSIKSQDVATNQTVISWSLKGAGGDSTWYKSGNFKVVIAGATVYSSATRIELHNGTTVASGTHTFVHNADGSKSFTASAEAGIYTTAVNCTGSGTFTLDTIPRASQPSLVTWPETTNDVGYFGEEFSIHMNRKSDAFTHTVRYAYGSRSGTIATGVTTGTTWAVPLAFMNDIPNATSASGLIYADTYNGSTKVGTKYTGFTVKVPASVKPSCTLKLEDVSGVGDIYGVPVQGLSKIKITVNTTPAYSSPIASYLVKANGVSYTAAVSTTEALKTAGSSPITVTVKDKRGRTGSASYTMNVLPYALPSISQLTVRRCNADGTENEQGEYVRAVFSATITALNNKNTAAYKLRYKKSTDASFTEVTLSNLANVYTVTNAEHIFAADSSHSYDVEIEAKDRHGTTTRSTSASTAFTLMNWGADGTSMGIGKVAEKANTLQIALDVEFEGKIRGAIFDAIYPVGSIYLAYNHTNPATLFGGTWTRIQNAFLWAVDGSGAIGQTGGAKEVTLTAAQIPAHNHGGTYTNAGSATKTHAWLASGGSAMAYTTVDAGGGEAHNNMPPYIQVSAWRRTA
jgi:microcystin-dependent protein